MLLQHLITGFWETGLREGRGFLDFCCIHTRTIGSSLEILLIEFRAFFIGTEQRGVALDSMGPCLVEDVFVEENMSGV